MKRLICSLLTIAILISLAPSVFADTATTENKGVKIVYDIGGRMPGWGTTGVDFSSFAYETTDNFWQYYENSLGTATVGNNFKWRGPQGLQIVGAGNWFAVKIKVPVSGNYKAEVKHAKFSSGGGKGCAVVLPTTVDPATFNSSVWDNIKDKLLCNIVCSGGASGVTWSDASGDFVAASTTTTGVHLDAGEYYLCYYYNSSGTNFGIGDFTLYTVDADGNAYTDYKPVSMGMVSFTTPEYDGKMTIGEETTVTASLSDSITHTAITDVIYTTSDADVATVAEDGTVTAVGPGKARISAVGSGYEPGSVMDVEVEVSLPDGTKNGKKIIYDIGSYTGKWGDTSVLFSSFTYDKTLGHWAYAGNSMGYETIDVHFKWRNPYGVQLGASMWYAIKINVPESGMYLPKILYGESDRDEGFDTYLVNTDEIKNVAEGVDGKYYIGEVIANEKLSAITWADKYTYTFEPRRIEKGEYYLIFKHSSGQYAYVGNFSLNSMYEKDGSYYEFPSSSYESVLMGKVTADENELTVGGETKVSAILSDSITSEAVAGAAFTYESSDEKILSVDVNGNVTAKAPGTATITAISAGYPKAAILGEKITVSVPTTDKKVSFAVAGSETDATVTVESDEFTYNGAIDSVSRGTEVTITAKPLENYIFVGWKRGSNSDYNSYISTENPFTTKLYTNTYLTAVYIAESAEKEAVVEYYNQNGDYISTLSPEETAPVPGTIPGFTFEAGNWFTGEDMKLILNEVTKRTRAVAIHTAKENAGIVTVNGEVSDVTTFDSSVTVAAEGDFTCWKRDGKVVSYNRNYTYYLWDSTEITQSNEEISAGKKVPLVVLDKDKVDGAYMIEYDAADYEIVEVGFVFSNSGIPTVDSCAKKFTSQRNLTHGQMSAKYSDNVRGYLIYKDGEDFRVIYSD